MMNVRSGEDLQHQENTRQKMIEEFYRENFDKLFSVAWSALGDFASAEDLTQDILIYYFKKLSTGWRIEKPLPWILQGIRRGAVERRKKRQKIFSLKTGHVASALPVDALDAHDVKIRVWNAIRDLEAEEREIVSLYVYNDMTFEQIAIFLELPPGTVYSKFRGALDLLKNRLRDLP